jgi:hypothetical protein
MHGLPAAILLAPLEGREVDDPEHGVTVRRDQTSLLGQVDAEPSQDRGRGGHDIPDEEEQVVGLRSETPHECRPHRLEKPRHRRLQRVGAHLHPDQALGSIALRLHDEIVELLPAHLPRPGDAKRLHGAAAADDLGEGLEFPVPEEVGHVDELETEAQVRLVGAEALHGLGIGQTREWRW